MTTLAVEQLLCHHTHFGGQEDEQGDQESEENNGSSTKYRKSSSKFVFNLWWTSFFTIFILTLGENLTSFIIVDIIFDISTYVSTVMQ